MTCRPAESRVFGTIQQGTESVLRIALPEAGAKTQSAQLPDGRPSGSNLTANAFVVIQLTKPKSGGLLLRLRSAPLTRRAVAYFCSGAHTPSTHTETVPNLVPSGRQVTKETPQG